MDEMHTQGMDKARQVLLDVFGYRKFRGLQEDVISHAVAGLDALVLMPTGGGKSLCYQVPALVRDGVTVVISPLKALMRDQVKQLEQYGVRAAALNSDIPVEQARVTERAMQEGNLDIVYVAPERFVGDRFQALLRASKIGLFAVDEAHCVSQWGHDFRKEYLDVGRLCALYEGVPRMALTATADEGTRLDMVKHLFLSEASVFLSSFDRPNISYVVVNKDEPKKQLLAFLKARPRQSGIVYCLTQKSVEKIADFLSTHGYRALPYHAGMDTAAKNRNQDAFILEEDIIIVATVAFGMGIDKPDVRFVAHMDLPSSMESYYQETGRAGRDGLPSDAWMTYGMQDIVKRSEMISNNKDGDEVHKRSLQRRLKGLLGYCESAVCRRTVILRHFGESYPGHCGNCDRCNSPVHTYDGTVDAQKLMSAAMRTGQRFGGNYLIDILAGVLDERIVHFGHDKLPTFGIGKDRTAGQWHHLLRQVMAMGLLEQSEHGSLLVTEEGVSVLRGMKIRLVEPLVSVVKARGAKATGTKPTVSMPSTFLPGDEGLMQALRAWRFQTARKQGVPSYVVFNDQTLAHLVSEKPSSVAAVAKVHGMGANRAGRYATLLLAVMDEHSRKQ